MSANQLSIRLAKKVDAEDIWRIRNHPLVRQESGDQNIITLSNHVKWFWEKYFSARDNYCYVLQKDKSVVGYCRFDVSGKSHLLSIAISPSCQGRGLGSVLLKKAIRLMGDNKNILAGVKVSNLVSRRLFEKNDFVIYKKNKNIIYFKYKKDKRLKVAIIGAGRIGAFFDKPGDKNILTHAHAFRSHLGFSLVGFVDSNHKRAQEAAKIWGGKAYKTVAELFENEVVDVICVATPDDGHFKILQSLKKYPIRGGLTEKPLTVNLNDSIQLIGDEFFQYHPFVVNYSLRYTPELQKIKSEIASGKFGIFVGGHGYYGRGLLHNGSHLLDLLLYFGLLVKNFTVKNKINDYSKKDPSISALLSIKGGGLFNLMAVSSEHYTLFEIDLFFSRARVRILNGGQELEIFNVVEDKNFSGYRRLFAQRKQKTSRLRRSMYEAVDNLCKAIVRKEKIICAIKDACDVQRLCQRIKNKQAL